jgi:hypothetical protein
MVLLEITCKNTQKLLSAASSKAFKPLYLTTTLSACQDCAEAELKASFIRLRQLILVHRQQDKQLALFS